MPDSLDFKNATMKKVYTLQVDLAHNPDFAEKVRRLTLNRAKPNGGLSGRYGLFGEAEWWTNIAEGRMPTEMVSGIIERAYVAGQDPDDINTIDLRLPDGSLRDVGIYVNDKADLQYFRPGHIASLIYALDELKKQPAAGGGVNHAEIAIEMSVSTTPAGAS